MKSDFNEAISTLSEVVQNRPKPIREFDQIFMKNEDMVKQAAFLAQQFSGLKVVFVGDGDSMALAVLHLWKRGLLPEGPAHLHVLDFDERIVKAINRFAEARGYRKYIAAELYNVAEPLPRRLIGRAEAFYTNPPWGASNGGESVIAFVQRGMEALNSHGLAAVVVANDPAIRWTQQVLQRAQRALLGDGFVITELGGERRHYHIDDNPNLQSCTIVAKRLRSRPTGITSRKLDRESFRNFYGRNRHLNFKYVLERNGSSGGRGAAQEYELKPF